MTRTAIQGPFGPGYRELIFAHISEFEGLRLLAYDDLQPNREITDAGQLRGILTIGYGHTGPDVYVGQRITDEEAGRLLEKDLKWAEEAVIRRVKVPLTPQQAAATVSFVYNIGASAFAKSTMLRKLNSGDTLGAANELTRWVKAGGKTLTGLVRRREAERALFLDQSRPISIITGYAAKTPEPVPKPQGKPAPGAMTKPLTRSKTAGVGVGGVALGGLQVWSEITGSAPEVFEIIRDASPYLLVALFAFIVFDRWRNARRGLL